MNREKKRTFQLSFSEKRLLVLTAILCILIEIAFVNLIYSNREAVLMNDSQAYGESVASCMELKLQHSISYSVLIEKLYEEYGDILLGDFERVSKRLVEGVKSVRSIYFAPGGEIAYVYPEKEIETTIGFNVLGVPELEDSINLAISTKKVTVAGPYHLFDGETGLLISNPIYDGDDFIAFSMIVLDWEQFSKEVVEEVGTNQAGYKFAVWKGKDERAVTDENGFIFSNTESDISKKINIKVDVPNDNWYLVVEPKEGWNIWQQLWPIIVLSLVCMIVIMIVVYNRIRRSSMIINMMEYDDLTGMYTKQAFYHYGKILLDKNSSVHFDLIIADIENFKLINGIYGENKGDEILQYLGNIVKKYTPENSICARIGGDQFVCLAESSKEYRRNRLTELMDEVKENSPISNLVVKYGVYEDVDRSLSVAAMCDRALIAVKSIKHNYEKQYAKYDGPVSKKHLLAQTFETRFEQALDDREFVVWYQPKFDARTEKLVSAEALVRWQMPDGRFVSPGDFIPVFEEDGLIVRLDEYVFRRVCRDIREWQQSGLQTVPISVNLSRASLHHDGIIDRYMEIVEEFGIDTGDVPIELTESAMLDNNQMEELANQLKEAGFQLHMDDFGTGVSSLSSINTLPFDVVKLDKSLIDLIGDLGGDELLKHIIELAHFKQMMVVAEGVETKKQLEFLRTLNCDVIQGYYYSPPKPYEEYVALIKKIGQNGKEI